MSYQELIKVKKHDDVYCIILAEQGIIRELSEYFKFRVPGYKFMPAYKNKIWDGFLYLMNRQKQTLYIGLVDYLQIFAKERDYNLEIDDDVYESKSALATPDFETFITNLKLPFPLYDYQNMAISHCIRNGRSLILSPTSSGKSMIIYCLTQWYKQEKVLLIVPTISLVSQMISDFKSYGYDSDNNCHGICEGATKTSKKRIIVSTWQAIHKMPKEWFDQFGVVIGDEAHLFKADSIKSIMHKLTKCKYKFGATGTLDGTKTNKLVLEGLFGPVLKVTTTKALMDNKQAAKLKIMCLLLEYPKEESKLAKKLTYRDEIAYIIQHNKRNVFIANLAVSMKTNTMVLFQYVDKHGKSLYETIKKKVDPSRKVFYVSGETDSQSREEIRAITETEKDAIIVASVGVFSTGISIKNLENLIFASPTKSRIRTLQSIGRVLRLGTSDKATLYDVVDDISYKTHQNFALKHFYERAKYYDQEKHDYKIHKIELKSKT